MPLVKYYILTSDSVALLVLIGTWNGWSSPSPRRVSALATRGLGRVLQQIDLHPNFLTPSPVFIAHHQRHRGEFLPGAHARVDRQRLKVFDSMPLPDGVREEAKLYMEMGRFLLNNLLSWPCLPPFAISSPFQSRLLSRPDETEIEGRAMSRTFALSDRLTPYQRAYLGEAMLDGEIAPLGPLLLQTDLLLGVLNVEWPTHDLQGTPDPIEMLIRWL